MELSRVTPRPPGGRGRNTFIRLLGCCLVAAAAVSVGELRSDAVERPGMDQAVPSGYVDRFISANGLRLHLLDWGAEGKRPMILLHGIGRTAHSFDHIAPRFNRDYHVIALERRGHGDSAWHPDGAYSVEDDVKDVEALVEQFRLRHFIIVGNSTGGRVAQVYAGLHPDMVAGLIVEDVGPDRPKDVAAQVTRQVEQDAGGWATEDELVKHLRAGGARVPEELDREYVRYATTRREDGRLIWKRDPNFAKTFGVVDLWAYVRRIASPTLYILGADSSIVPLDAQQRLKATIPDCEIVVMKGIGHYPHLEAPDEYVRLINRFLSRAASGKRP